MKKMFLKVSQNLWENNYCGVSFKTHHEKRRSVSNVKLAFFSISREVNIVNSVVNLNSPNIFNLLSYAFKTD